MFLANDIFIAHPIADIFDSLGHFDLALAQDHYARRIYKSNTIAEGFIPFNSGVIGYRNTDEVQQFFQTWVEAHNHYVDDAYLQDLINPIDDQKSLWHVLYQSRLRLLTLPTEYNYSPYSFSILTGYVRVLRGAYLNLPKLSETLNNEPAYQRLTFHYNRLIQDELYVVNMEKGAWYQVLSSPLRYVIHILAFLWGKLLVNWLLLPHPPI